MNNALLGLVAAVVLAASLCRGYFVDEDVARRALENQGYTNVQVTERAALWVNVRGCGSDDGVRFTVTATNPAGQEVETYVCADILKGGTIRSR